MNRYGFREIPVSPFEGSQIDQSEFRIKARSFWPRISNITKFHFRSKFINMKLYYTPIHIYETEWLESRSTIVRKLNILEFRV